MHQPTTTDFPRTIGMDLGRRSSHYCVFETDHQRGLEGQVPSTRTAMRAFFKAQPTSRVVMEASGPCRWIAEEAPAAGHAVVVANPREFRVILTTHKKCDRNDARVLGDFGQFKPHLLHPIQLRGTKCQSARTLLGSRAQIVSMRTELINMIGASIRDLGIEIGPRGASNTAYKRLTKYVPAELEDALLPLLGVLEKISKAIDEMDRSIERVSKEDFKETEVLRQVDGVGPITALTFAATVEDPKRFKRSRDVGAYAGLVPRARSSSDSNPELSISKRGDAAMRRSLVNAATFILGPRGKDCDLRRWGVKLQERGGQRSRAKARIAVARKLAVLLHRLMLTGEVYDPDRQANLAAA